MDKTQELLANEPISKLLVRYSIPAIIGMLVNALYNVVDRMFIGNIPNVGKLATAGIGVTMPITTILIAFGMLVGIGAITNISIKLGEGKIEEADRVLGNSITLSIIIGIVLTFIGIIFGEKILILFGASEQSLPYAQPFVNIILLGAVFNIAAFTLNSTIRGDGNPKLAAIIMSVGCILNIFLDYIFIFKFNMGIEGAAIATVIAQVITAIWGIMYYIKGKSNLKLRLKNIRIESKIIKGILVIALTQFCMELSAGFIHLITNKVLKLYGGDLAIGAMTAITSINLLFYMPVFGISQGMQTIIAYNYGAKQFDRAKKALSIGMIGAIGILSLGLIATRLFPEILIGIFTKDATLMELALNGISIYSLTLPAVGICILGAVYFQSIGNAKMSIVLSLLRQVIVFIPLILLIPKLLGLNGVWAAQPLADIISTLIIVGFLIKEFKVDSVRELSYR